MRAFPRTKVPGMEIVVKEIIGKLSRGVIEYDLPIVETSVSEISKVITSNAGEEGAFSVFSENNARLKGIVYSTSEKVHIENDKFSGLDNIIRYKVNTQNCEDGTKIEGSFNVVTNGGEVVIPYEFTVKDSVIKSYDGEVEDLFHFTNLVRTGYEEAIKIFRDGKFSRYLLKDNLTYQALYEGLNSGKSTDVALEEFLIGINKKQRITFSIDDENREYDSLEKDYGDIILVSKDGWGYAEIDIQIDGEFIRGYKKKITTEEFAGNNYEYNFSISIDRLHKGMNYGRIIFSTTFQKLECRISVENGNYSNLENMERNMCTCRLTDMYLKFRMRRYSVNEWADDSLRAIERMRGFDDNSNFIKLVQAQIYLSRSMDEQAGWLLGSVAKDILDEREKDIELYAYYLYIRSLQKRNPEMTEDVLRKVKHYYENGYDSWRLLWILLYLDNSYENNKSLKIARIKEQYNKGCRSPLMYFEALNAFSRQPMLLRVINDFELQVLNFGCKYEGISNRLASQISEVAATERKFKPLLFKVLTTLYENLHDKEILATICGMLIKGNKTDKKYYKWFRLGIENDIRLAKLYEYYIFTMDEESEVIFPERLLMYFLNNSESLMDKREVLYANIISSKLDMPEIYRKYESSIEKFALEQIDKGRINENLAVIYEGVLRESLINEEIGNKLIPIMNTYKVECFNENVCEVIVIHKELIGEKHYPIINGQAYIQIYTEDSAIVFVDKEKNRYSKTINYTLKHVYNAPDYMKLCAKMEINDVNLMANLSESVIKYHSDTVKFVRLFISMMERVEFRPNFKYIMMNDVIDFYYNNYDGDELDGYLLGIKKEYLTDETRKKVAELMLLRGIDKNIEEYISEVGIEKLSPRKLMKYCMRRFFNEDMPGEDKHLLNICIYVFKKGKYNQKILEYLSRYYNGTTKEMLDVWRTGREYGCIDREFEERIIAQMLFTRTHLSSIAEVFDSYYKNGASEEVKKAYLFYQAYTYVVKDLPVADSLFKYYKIEFEKNDDLNNLCKTAFVKHYSENEADKETLKICSRLINDLVNYNIMFDFYKKYKDRIELPPEVLENVVIEYRARPDQKVKFVYVISDTGKTQENFITENMNQVFKGIYTKKIMLFCEEHLMYYITEQDMTDTELTESKEYSIDMNLTETDATRYSKINEILICKELKEESTVKSLMDEYYIEKQLTDRLFN